MHKEVRYLLLNLLLGLLIALGALSIEIFLGDYLEGTVPAREQLLQTILVQMAFAFVPLVVALVIVLVSIRFIAARMPFGRFVAVGVMLCLGLMAFVLLLVAGNARFGAISLAASVSFGTTMRLPTGSGGGAPD